MSKTILADVSGFTPLIDDLARERGLTTAAVFGVVWRHCQFKDGVCKASLATIADYLGVDRSTVLRHLELLIEDGYLVDLTPELRNRPHIYADTGKAGIRISIDTTVAESNTGVAPRNATVAQRNSFKPTVAESNTGVAPRNATVAESDLSKVLKKPLIKQDDEDTGSYPPVSDEALKIWQAALGELQLQMTKPTFETWVKSAQVLSYMNDVFIIGVMTPLFRDWLERNLLSSIKRSLSGIVGHAVDVTFVVADGHD